MFRNSLISERNRPIYSTTILFHLEKQTIFNHFLYHRIGADETVVEV